MSARIVAAVEEPAAEEPGLDEAPEPADEPSYAGRGFLMLGLLAAGLALVIYRIYPTHHPLAKNPNFVDLIFSNDLVVLAARLVLLSAAGVLAVAAVFIVISFWKRAKAGHWMSRFGPFETQAVEDLQGAVNQWIQWWQEEYNRRTELEERVEQSDQLLNELNDLYQGALVEVDRLRGEGDGDAA